MAISLDHYSAESHQSPGSELRLVYRLFEDAQRARIAHGERLRAFLQGRSFAGSGETCRDVEELLTEIQRGHAAGAPVLLERAYARAADEEAMLAVELRGAVEGHPAWTWLEQQRGIGHLLAARLLSRLDVVRATTPSAFWAYCGLATVPGTAYRCTECGLEAGYPNGYRVNATHQARAGSKECKGELSLVADQRSTRVAPRRTIAGGRATYDAQARKSCYLIGVSLLRTRSDYRSYYDAERERLDELRAGWIPKRCHLSALRKMEKAFLRDLWLAWRKAVNLPVVQPYFPRMQRQA
ncbi:MAG TPA: hypothetical protein VK575_01825 [Gemmatimonadaceae bacterium]|nr:hypothetical protein [Gemmatimonadaceae bacterium]